jgi:NhaA family Na+:H+ antiporter
MSAFVVMPLFALANAGVQLRLGAFQSEDAVRMGLGLGAGLIVGKTFGILGAAWLVVRLGVVRLPQEVTWRMVAGVGMLAGIGFTLSIFIAALAFEYTPLFDAAKMSIFIASIISAGLGLSLLRRATRHRVPAAQTTL